MIIFVIQFSEKSTVLKKLILYVIARANKCRGIKKGVISKGMRWKTERDEFNPHLKFIG